MELKRTASTYPTVDEINALPKKFRQYIHDLENRCDKSGDVQTIAILRQDRVALQQRVEELEARIALQEREYFEAPIETD
jgi:BMFP domain-containing protein YqiC